MGRGRAKAKQTKVARRLKYSTPSMDLDALRQELSGSGSEEHHGATHEDDDFEHDEYEDPYADVYDDAEDEDDEESSAGGR
ncbi:MAG: DUF3073 domain-containing protein [Actinobacteria bacterium]|nr:DUF3073 domain-containing protein [Actinomycetota bacterium]MCB9411712.1 DUF3073 domain-containing protein [Actinomycetota bacterium]